MDLSPTRTATSGLPRRRADGRARARPATYVEQAVREPTAHQVARSLLTGAVRAATASDGGGEGSSTGAGLASPDAAVLRDAQVARLRARLERALDDGDLPPHADANLLARHLVTVSSGIEAQADGGVGAGELHQVVDVALQVWPPI